MAANPGRLKRLRNAGVIYGKGRLPKEYAEVIDELSEQEVDVIISVTERLEQADKKVRAGLPKRPKGYDIWSWMHF
jgi:hypothetical protein